MASLLADNRWGKMKWGGTKWGASANRAALAWGLDVDWDGDGDFEGPNEGSRMVAFSLSRGRKNMLSPIGLKPEPVEVGRLELIVDNYDGRYTPSNASSPLYPNVVPGRDVKFRVRDLNGGSTYNVFYGIIDDIVPFRDENGAPFARIVAEDTMNFLKNAKPILALDIRVIGSPHLNFTSGIVPVLQSIQWPARWSWQNVSVGSSQTSFWSYWAPYGMSAADYIYLLSTGTFDNFYISADGKATYDRNGSLAHTPVLTLNEADVLKDIQPSQPWLLRRNLIRIRTKKRASSASGVIWSLGGEKPSITNGSTYIFVAQYYVGTEACPASNVLQPVATTDWTTNTAADGTGTDKTANCTLTIQDQGDRALVTVVNSSGGTVYLTKAQIKGQAYPVSTVIDVSSPRNPYSVASPRELLVDNSPVEWSSDGTGMTGRADQLYNTFLNPPPCVRVQLRGQPTLQFTPDLFNHITADFPTIGLNSQEMVVAAIEMESHGASCQDVTTTWYLEPPVALLT